jgi:hypothetical protein
MKRRAARQFDLHQLALLTRAIRRGEELVADHYRIPMLPCKQYPYEVVTLSEIQGPERAREALAHLVVYERSRPAGAEHLYRICLQDDAILRRAGSEGDDWLCALLVYVLTHELVHVVRFQRAEQSYQAPASTRQREEDEVHRITLGLLRSGAEPRWERLNELYGNPVVPAQVIGE